MKGTSFFLFAAFFWLCVFVFFYDLATGNVLLAVLIVVVFLFVARQFLR